jgi:ribosome biogenesis protein BRX1
MRKRERVSEILRLALWRIISSRRSRCDKLFFFLAHPTMVKKRERPTEEENEVVPAKKRRNKQRVLLLSSRGITHRMRHLMNDLEALLPQVKKGTLSHKQGFILSDKKSVDSKLDSKSQLHLLPELADLYNCNNTLYFEARRHEDLYMWAAKTPNGPSIKMLVQNVHTMDELKMTGNCLKGSRGILSFDKGFEESEWGRLTKEVFTQVSDQKEIQMN